MRIKITVLLVAVVGLSACSSELVPVSTRDGVVQCQPYMSDVVLLDHSVTRPEGMTKPTADNICKAHASGFYPIGS